MLHCIVCYCSLLRQGLNPLSSLGSRKTGGSGRRKTGSSPTGSAQERAIGAFGNTRGKVGRAFNEQVGHQWYEAAVSYDMQSYSPVTENLCSQAQSDRYSGWFRSCQCRWHSEFSCLALCIKLPMSKKSQMILFL